MLTTAEATQAINDAMPMFGVESVLLEQAAGRVLRQVVSAERDQPPFDRVTMDGIAIRFASLASGNRQFVIQGTQHAGDPVQALVNEQNCIEIMTGGVLPEGTDCIVPVERIAVADNIATIEAAYDAKASQFIHPQGSDHVSGHKVLQSGAVISPMDIAIIASCGLNEIAVGCAPKIRVISTGNELVPPGQPVAAHQIRLSNGPALVAMLSGQGFGNSSHHHLVDDVALLEREIGQHLETADVMILSGGVSMGKADFVPQVLKELGVKVVFHKISQRPGKPMWFGIGPAGQAVFALPGNPVSSLVCCRQYVLPALFRASGRIEASAQYAVLAEDVTFTADLTCFLPVRTDSTNDGGTHATPVPTNTSGDFAALGDTDGYIELCREESNFPAGSVVPLHLWTTP
jgi:molybdopterin molybdotransferase